MFEIEYMSPIPIPAIKSASARKTALAVTIKQRTARTVIAGAARMYIFLSSHDFFIIKPLPVIPINRPIMKSEKQYPIVAVSTNRL